MGTLNSIRMLCDTCFLSQIDCKKSTVYGHLLKVDIRSWIRKAQGRREDIEVLLDCSRNARNQCTHNRKIQTSKRYLMGIMWLTKRGNLQTVTSLQTIEYQPLYHLMLVQVIGLNTHVTTWVILLEELHRTKRLQLFIV